MSVGNGKREIRVEAMAIRGIGQQEGVGAARPAAIASKSRLSDTKAVGNTRRGRKRTVRAFAHFLDLEKSS